MGADAPARVQRLALLGCGLMGGSFALALKDAGAVGTVVGHSRQRHTTEEALALGVVDAVAASAAEAVEGADVVLVAVPVTATEGVLRALRPALGPEALVMDVGSTKRDVVAAARAALGDRVAQFVPAHPIAGKSSGGVAQAEAALYRQRHAVLTPLPDHTEGLLGRAQALWEAVGCRVVRMDAHDHDATFAAVSHLPHLLAFAYMQGLLQQPQAAQHLALAGPGFRDFSRIAGSTSAIWRDIFAANRDQVLLQLQAFEGALQRLKSALAEGHDDEVARLVDEAAAVRGSWRLM